jgi:dihydrofolate reductase
MKVVLIAALSADGFIGRHSTHTADWTGTADKRLFVRVTKALGTMVMGASTFATIGRALPGRRTIVYTHHPERVTAAGVETTAQANLVDELYLTITPLLFGRGLPLFTTELSTRLQLLTSEQLDDGAVMLHYKVTRP